MCIPLRVIEMRHDFVSIAPAVEDALAASGVAPGTDCAHDLRLALTEALNNIVEHGGGDDRAPPIRVLVSRARDAISLTVEDCGPPLSADVLAVLSSVSSEVAVPCPMAGLDTLPEGGWGLMLIRESVDRVDIRREGRRNILRLEKRLPRGAT